MGRRRGAPLKVGMRKKTNPRKYMRRYMRKHRKEQEKKKR